MELSSLIDVNPSEKCCSKFQVFLWKCDSKDRRIQSKSKKPLVLQLGRDYVIDEVVGKDRIDHAAARSRSCLEVYGNMSFYVGIVPYKAIISPQKFRLETGNRRGLATNFDQDLFSRVKAYAR
ncbi:hypothetical protein QTP88_006388 [Uroleucon formosanum]